MSLGTRKGKLRVVSQLPTIITPQEAFDLGWPIIPTNKNKAAMLTSWKAYQDRKPTVEEFQTWLKRNPPGWAIVTGALSGRITMDFDGEIGLRTFEKLKLQAHRSTPSGGYHVDFSHPGWRVSTLSGKVKIELGNHWPGMDIRADGGYVIFFGEKYTWFRNPDPYPFDLLPQDLRAFLGWPVGDIPVGVGNIIKMALDRVPAEGRNSAGFWLATQLRDNRFEQNNAFDAMQIYRSKCPSINRKGEEEEYTEAETIASLEQAYGRSARQPWTAPKLNGGIHEVPMPGPSSRPGHAPGHKHYQVGNAGVFYVDDETESKIFVSSLLEVLAYARDQNSESWGRLLRWKDPTGNLHSWVVPMRMLVGDGVAVREALADGGLDIGTNPKTNHLLAQYIRMEQPSQFIHCIPFVGWFDRTFVLPDEVIPSGNPVAYQSQGRGEHFYRTSGTLESWQNEISKKCRGNSRLVFAVSAAFAGPLLRPLNVQGGGFHFRAASSVGKSTTQWLAGSVWGGGGANGFARTWASTKNASESTAEMHNDGVLLLDEMRLIDPREVEQVVYMLANGSGKSRETRNMTGRRTLQWRLMILSSGEITLSDCAALAGVKIKGGAEIRMATILADAEKGLGIFEQLHGTDDPRIFAETLQAAAKRNYGIPIRRFLEYLIANWDSEIASSELFLKTFIENANLPIGSPSEIQRVLERFGVVACAGEIATQTGITAWEAGEATQAAYTCFESWLQERGGFEPTDIRNAIAQIRKVISSGNDRFYPAEPKIFNSRDGEEIVRSEHIHNALGYWKVINEQQVYLVNTDSFEQELCGGFPFKDVAKELAKRKLLLTVEPGRYTYKAEVTLPSGVIARPRFYAIKGGIIEI